MTILNHGRLVGPESTGGKRLVSQPPAQNQQPLPRIGVQPYPYSLDGGLNRRR